jgi:hypothetical protein
MKILWQQAVLKYSHSTFVVFADMTPAIARVFARLFS